MKPVERQALVQASASDETGLCEAGTEDDEKLSDFGERPGELIPKGRSLAEPSSFKSWEETLLLARVNAKVG
jgi:hypothetical protein